MMKDTIQAFTKNLDAGYCKQIDLACKDDGYTWRPLRYFAEDARQAGVYAEEKEVDEAQRYWLCKLGIPEVTPTPGAFRRREKVLSFAQDWATLKMIFRELGLPMHGDTTAVTEKAFTTTSAQSLFPIFFDTNIQAGLLASPVLDRLIMETVPVNSHTATHLQSAEVAGDHQYGVAGEGTVGMNFRLVSRERTVRLKKFMGELNVSYEVMRLQRLNFVALQLQRIGRRFAQYLTDFAIATLIDGDGDEPAITDVAATGIVYNDLVDLEMDFAMDYMPDTILAPKQVISKILKAAEFKDPLAGILHQTTGRVPSPIGWDLVRWDVTGNVTTYAATNVVVFDSDLSLTQYTEGGLLVESERVIRAQWETSVTSTWTGFGIWDRQAARRGTGW